jgi:hypothetical protein
MSYQATVVEILLAGPGDVVEERREIAEAIETWNQRHSHQMNIVMRPVTWETDTYPELGGDSQAIINRQLTGRCAAVIAVFATRLGTTTPRAASGTAEEIDRFYAEGKPVAVYFSNGQIDLPQIDVSQLQALQGFKESLRPRGLYREYQSISNLRKLIDQHLTALGYRFQAPLQAHEPQQVGAKTAFDPTEADMRVIAAAGRLMVETGSSHVNGLYLRDEPELAGVSGAAISESIRVLKVHNLVTGGQGRWEVSLTSDGLETWLLNFLPKYDREKQRIANAIVKGDIRDPALLPGETGVPATIVDHVLRRWRDRNLLILNSLYDGIRIDRFAIEIRQLAEEDIQDEGTSVGASQSNTDLVPRYRIVAKPVGLDVIALSDFGGELGDPVAAAVKVAGRTVVQVVAPSRRSAWDPQLEEQFRSQLRQLAANHHLLNRQGEVRLIFDPSQTSMEKRDETAGELVKRK